MKTKILTIIVLTFFIASITHATESPKLKVASLTGEKVLVSFETKSPLLFEISISKKDGTLIYFEKNTIRAMKYCREFDFSKFRNGNYTISLNYGNQSINKIISVLNSKIEVSPARNCYEPFYSLQDGKLKVSHLNIACKSVYLNIYKDGQLISCSKLGREMLVQKILNLKNLDSGEYEIVLCDWFKDHKSILKI